jgi:hypothetical protein
MSIGLKMSRFISRPEVPSCTFDWCSEKVDVHCSVQWLLRFYFILVVLWIVSLVLIIWSAFDLSVYQSNVACLSNTSLCSPQVTNTTTNLYWPGRSYNTIIAAFLVGLALFTLCGCLLVIFDRKIQSKGTSITV